MSDAVETLRDPAAPAAEGGAGPLDLPTRLAKVAGYVKGLQRGERAELRRLRMGGSRIPPEVFWRIVERYDIHRDDEPFWMAVLPLMVRHPHGRGRMPGHVLEDARVSPARLERWLRLGREGALREADRLFSAVEADTPLDWVELGSLLCFWNDDLRRRLARDFFLTRERRASTTSTEGGE